ncbi:DoxX family protein [Flagellimonas sp.]|uniref:DoxX family protein n=1 Tax=Flagellimonas sp. TaxID=2058762 RepID=UPI003BA96F83
MSKLNDLLNPYCDYGVIFIRLAFGFHLLFYSWSDVVYGTASNNAGWLESMGFPLPIVMAWAYQLTEFIGGILLILGLWVRWISIPLVFTFVVAYFLVHFSDPYEDAFQAIQLLCVSLFFFFNGAGKLSLDGIIKKG